MGSHSTDRRSVYAVLLAAGASTRMGRDKLLMEIDGRTVFEITLENHLGSSLTGVCAVVPGWIEGFKDVIGRSAGTRTAFVEMAEPCVMSVSLQAGWRWVLDNTDTSGVMVSLADQPLVRPETIGRLIDAYVASKKPFCAPTHEGRRGHPVIISPEFDRSLMSLEGDRGARALLAEWPDLVLEVEVGSDEVVLDLDLVEHLNAITERLSGHG